MNIIEKIERLNELVRNIPEGNIKYRSHDPTIDKKICKQHLESGKWSLIHFSVPSYALGANVVRVVPWLPSNLWTVGDTMNNSKESSFSYNSIKHWMVSTTMEILLNSKTRCEQYKNDWETYKKTNREMFQLFDNLDGLNYIEQWVHNEDNWPKVEIGKMSDYELEQRDRKLSLTLDNTPENIYRLQLIASYKSNSFLPELPEIEFGIHDERTRSSFAHRASHQIFDLPFERLEKMLIQSVCFAHGFGADTDQMAIFPTPTSSSSDSVLFVPLELLLEPPVENADVSDVIKRMPEYSIALELHKKKSFYNGITHMEVAALMDEKYNDPKKAWKYLQAAGYWVGKNMPEAQGAVLDAAMHLCDKHGWKEALEVLECNKKLMSE